MNYEQLSINELSKYPYPNLIAEIIESHYSICTVADHMGMGIHRKEDDPEVQAKLRGKDDISFSEALGLVRLFNSEFEYLFDHKLWIFNEKPVAYWRWFEESQKREEEMKRIENIQTIERELRKKPYLLDFMKEVSMWSREEVNKAIELLAQHIT